MTSTRSIVHNTRVSYHNAVQVQRIDAPAHATFKASIHYRVCIVDARTGANKTVAYEGKPVEAPECYDRQWQRTEANLAREIAKAVVKAYDQGRQEATLAARESA